MLPSATHRVTLEGPEPEAPATKPPQPLQSAGAVPRPGCAAGALLALPAASPGGHTHASVGPAHLPAESFSAPRLRASRLRHTWVYPVAQLCGRRPRRPSRRAAGVVQLPHGCCPEAHRPLHPATQLQPAPRAHITHWALSSTWPACGLKNRDGGASATF